MKTCPTCQKDIEDQFSFCPNCGGEIRTNRPSTIQGITTRFNVSDGVRLGVGIFIVLPLLLFLGVLAFGFITGVLSVFLKAFFGFDW